MKVTTNQIDAWLLEVKIDPHIKQEAKEALSHIIPFMCYVELADEEKIEKIINDVRLYCVREKLQ